MSGGKFEKVEGSEFELECDLVLLAMGFVGPEREDFLDKLGVEYNGRGNVVRDDDQSTVPVFVAGDAGRGQSLIVWAIAEGRSAAGADLPHAGDLPPRADSPRRPPADLNPPATTPLVDRDGGVVF